jgi:hypothetical protein
MKPVLAALLWIALAAAPASAAGGEHLVVSGGVSLIQWEKYKAEPHDLWWLNFIRAARIRIQELRERHGPDARITWFVYAPAYRRRSAQEGKDLIADIESVRGAYGVKLVFFGRTSELVDYINGGLPRPTTPIVSFDYFGHSNRACFMFDYSNEIDSASKVFLHEDDLGRIRRGVFARNAEVKSWGCHTGESMSKKWKAATGVPMTGAAGKTRYQTETLPIISTVGGRWVR